MADSPFCLNCLNGGILAHTYHINRTRLFKCGRCKRITEEKQYEPLDFEWRNKFTQWETKVKNKLEEKKIRLDQMKPDFERIRSIQK